MAVIEEIIEDNPVPQQTHDKPTEVQSSRDTSTKKTSDLDITAPLEKLVLSEDEVRMIPFGLAVGTLCTKKTLSWKCFEPSKLDLTNCYICFYDRSCSRRHRGTRRQGIRLLERATTMKHSSIIS
jgi:hypothetical protein